MNIPKAIIAQAIVNFLQSMAWEQFVELLLEHAFDIEVAISSFATKLEEGGASSSRLP